MYTGCPPEKDKFKINITLKVMKINGFRKHCFIYILMANIFIFSMFSM